MDYEKKYKEALERARNLHKDAIDMDENIRAKQCEIIFPELAESENERIKRELIDYINRLTASPNNIEKYNTWIAWLEKQGKQKPYWSEEDERILDAFITSLNNEVFAGRLETLKGIGVSLVIKWLKSLKDRCTWKPSEE